MTLKRTAPKPRQAKKKLAVIDKKHTNLFCFRCGVAYDNQHGNFQKTRSSFYEKNGGYLHVCTKCVKDLLAHYSEIYDGDLEKVCYTLCLNFNIYFSKDIYLSSANSKYFSDNPFGTYCSRSNMTQYSKWRDFTDTLDQQNVLDGAMIAPVEEIKEASIAQDGQIPQAILNRWGVGYVREEYEFMQGLYRTLLKQKPNLTPLQDDLIVDACKYKCQHNRLIQGEDPKASEIKTLSALYQENLKSVGIGKDSGDEGIDDSTFGSWVRDIEKHCPAEDYRDPDLYKDVGGIGEYIERHLFRPLKNWLTGSKDKDTEFFMEDEDA